ncbi:MAG: translation initiation factor IF-2 [Saprospirales bacterium]|nr:MAG: translation initiation factor IF-2 [Saprospirales bacterium]
MVRKIITVARELNVGKNTIVDHLIKKGFDIENKPNAKLTEEMYQELLNEFQSSISIKEKADKLIIGNRPVGETGKSKDRPKMEPPPLPPKFREAPRTEEKVEQEIEKEISEPVEVVAKTEEVNSPETAIQKEEPEAKEQTPEVEIPEEAPKTGLKVVGKIELDKPAKKTRKEKPQISPEDKVEEKVETTDSEVKPGSATKSPETAEKPTEEPEVEKPVETAKKPESQEAKSPEEASEPEGKGEKASDEDGDMHIKKEVPQLKGLKILGKIDTKKFEPPKKKAKPKEAEKSDAEKDEEGKRKRRRRKRTKVAARTSPGTDRGRRAKPTRKKDEVKEVSQKEIDEQIKATLARLSGGKKSKRQKIRKDNRERHKEKQELEATESETQTLQVTEFISVSELASLMDVSPTDVIMNCMNLGVIVSINQRLDAEIIELVAQDFGFETEFISAEEQVTEEEEIADDPEDLRPRAPIVTVMGHVDHGKTSLLDYIRSAKVAAGEAGGITQHIGAYEVKVGEENRRITFLDTPGHEAFTAMRARGAKVTDVAVIIVAADDRIMPQTKEAISHAQAADVPIVFAINKIDKPGADPERIKQELANMNYLVEEWGGKYQSQDISAIKGTNVDELLEKILLESDLLELKANPSRRAIGTVLEASLDKGRGYVTKVLIQNGTLQMGDPVVAGEYQGKIKAMFNEHGKRIKEAGPSKPVLILGLNGAPQAGEQVKVLASESETKDLASKRAQINREQSNRASKRISLDEIGRRLALGTFKELNLIVKGDVDGSIEALSDVLIKLSIENVQVNVIHKAVGQIIESDVLLASASDAIIIGFQVRPSMAARKLAEKEGVQIRTYSIIYEAIEEIKSAIQGMLEPVREENITGNLEVREVYKISRVGTVAGCYVTDGKIHRNSFIRVIRDGIVIYPTKEGVTGEISSLKRFKDDVKEVKTGLECGVTIKNFNDLKVGDNIEAYEVVEVRAEI